MASEQRREWAVDLARQVNAPIVWDELQDVWDTGRRALLAHLETGSTHSLTLQDDAIIPPDLVGECEKLLQHVPDDVPVSLYMGRYRHRPRRFSMTPVVEAAKRNGASFAVFPGPWWGVGIILPTKDIEAVVAFGDKATHRNYDIRIAQYYASVGIDCWYTTPSIIDHREGLSLVGGRGPRRHAEWFGEPPDWSGCIVTPADMRIGQRFPVTP